MNATLIPTTHTNEADYPRRQVHITSIPVSQHTCNVQDSTPANHHGPSHSEEEDLTWPFASSPAVYIKGVDTVRNINKFYRKLHAVFITTDGCHYVWQKAKTAILHYARGPADLPTLKQDTDMLTHLPLGDSGTRLQRNSQPRTSMFRRISLLVSWA